MGKMFIRSHLINKQLMYKQIESNSHLGKTFAWRPP